jgi:hypothetical protein
MTSHARIYRSDSRRQLNATAWQILTELRRCLRYGSEYQISHADLARRFGRSEATISSAMRQLEAESLITRRELGAGRGYAVALIPPPELMADTEDVSDFQPMEMATPPQKTDPTPPENRSPHPYIDHLAAAAAGASRQDSISPMTLTDEEPTPMSQPAPSPYRPRPQAAEAYCTIAEWRRLMRVATQTDEWIIAQFEAAKARKSFQNLVAVVYRACQDDEPITTVEEIAAKAAERARELAEQGPVIVDRPATPQAAPRPAQPQFRPSRSARPEPPPMDEATNAMLNDFMARQRAAQRARMEAMNNAQS